MRRGRKLAIALLAVVVVIAAVYATGAFTSMTASRSVDVRVAGDGSAFLSLQPSEGPNGKYASYGPGGALRVTIGGAAGPSPATGVNPDSTTVFKNVFTITNKGSQPVSVWITDKNPAVTFIQPDGTSLEAKSGAVTIRPGGRSLHVGLVIDSRGVKPGTNLLKTVTIHTDADVSDVPVGSVNDGEARSNPGLYEAKPSTSANDGCGWNLRCHFTNLVGNRPGSGSSASGGSGGSDGPVLSVGSMITGLQNLKSTVVSVAREHPIATQSVVAVGTSLFATPSSASDDAGGSSSGRPVCLGNAGIQGGKWASPYVGSDGEPMDGYTWAGGDRIQGGKWADPETGGHCVEKDYDRRVKIPDSVKTAGTFIVVVAPVDGMGPTDEAVGAAWAAKKVAPYAMKAAKMVVKKAAQGAALIASVFLAGGNAEKTEQRETEETEGEQETKGDQQGKKDEDSGSSNRCGFLGWKCWSLFSDGGTEDRPPGYDALREQGVPEATIEKWNKKGYDLKQMSQALATYRNSGKTLPSNYGRAKGELGEILAKPIVTKMYPPSRYEYVQGVKLNKGAITEIDWVVVDKSTGNVVATYQVKAPAGKADAAQRQLKTGKGAFMKPGYVKSIDDAPSSLTKSDFERNFENINRYTVGPSGANGYDKTFDLTEDELEALLEMIRK